MFHDHDAFTKFRLNFILYKETEMGCNIMLDELGIIIDFNAVHFSTIIKIDHAY